MVFEIQAGAVEYCQVCGRRCQSEGKPKRKNKIEVWQFLGETQREVLIQPKDRAPASDPGS